MHQILIILIFLFSNCASADWSAHIKARVAVVAQHSGMIGSGKTLLLGDSNTEMFWWNSVNGCQLVNAGIGGARVHDIAAVANYFASVTRPKILHLMIGTNDVHDISLTLDDDLQSIFDAFNSVGTKIIVWPVPPFASKFGSRQSLLNRFEINEKLRRLALSNGAAFDWWWPAQFEQLDGFSSDGVLLSDGVHFTRKMQVSRYYRVAKWNAIFGSCR